MLLAKFDQVFGRGLMAIESATCFRRLARTGLLTLVGSLSLSGIAAAQKELVTTGSVIPLQHSTAWCQIYKIIKNPVGDTLLLDVCGGGGYGSIYQLNPGSTTFQTVTPTIDTAGTYWNEDMTMDAKGTLYITDRYGSQHLYRVPYNPSDGTYDFSESGDNWEPTLDGGFENNGTQNVAFLDSPAKDGSGTLFVSEQNANAIVMIPVNADGTVPTFSSGANAGQPEFQYLINGLEDKVMPMAVDVNGNLYFIENPYDSPSARATGVFFIPETAYKSCFASMSAPTTPCISGTESGLSRIDPGNTEKFNGMTLDAAGNVYVADASDGYGGTRNGLLMIPNESGSPVGVTATSFNFEDAEYLSPTPINSNPMIDSRGFVWLPTGGSGNWSPDGSSAIPGTGNIILYQLGAANLGSTPVGTPSSGATVFFTFSNTVTPGSLAFSQPGGGTDFSAGPNPYPPPAGTTPAVPCTAGTTYIAFTSCQYWVTFNPQGANAVGLDEGQLSMLDSTNAVIGGSTAFLNGIGEGPEVALLVPAMQTPLATGLVTPDQVAGDSQGNAYVADAGQGKVLLFPAGLTTASAGQPIGKNLKAPTGVAVDRAGDVYIGDSGNVIEIPSVNGTLNAAGQTTLMTGLGSNLQLAVDGSDNVYVADPSNARVVRIYNPQMGMIIDGIQTVGSGFTKPTAVAVDNSGDVFVADGTNLDEVNPWGGQTAITSNLSSPVTGIVADPSGAIYVAQSGGIIRIPLESSGLNFNDAVAVDSDGVTTPKGIGIDSFGDLYVTASSYNVSTLDSTGAGTSAVNTPDLLLLNGAFVNFGIVSQQTQSNPVDVNVYNIGNAPLALTAAPTFGGANATDYSIQSDGQNPCDTSGSTLVVAGTPCQLGVTVTAQGLGLSQGTMAVTTTALNSPTSNTSLEAYSSNLLCKTDTSITLNPASGLVYPGSTTVTSTTVADPNSTCAAGGSPQGGNVVLTLQPQAKGASPSTQTAVLPASGQYSFNLTGLNGGTYVLYVSYRGDSVYGGSSSTRTFTITVAQAAAAISLSEPNGVTAINGVYYIKQGSTSTMQATVTSPAGTPSGSVTFMNGSTTLGTSTLDASGNAIFSTTNLTSGSTPSNLGAVYNITAVYSGDTNFASVTSSAAGVDVVPSTGVALITANPTSVSTKAGTPVTSTLTITSLEGYSPKQNVQLYCASATLPKYAECTFDVPQVDLFDHPGVPQTSHITISSDLAITLSEQRMGASPIVFAGVFGLGLLGLTFRKRAKFHRSSLTMACLLLVFAGALFGFTGCTNSGYTHTPPAPQNTTPPGTYSVTVYALDLQTQLQTSLPMTLTVTIQ
jgi:hypothetical protein